MIITKLQKYRWWYNNVYSYNIILGYWTNVLYSTSNLLDFPNFGSLDSSDNLDTFKYLIGLNFELSWNSLSSRLNKTTTTPV